MNNRVFDLIILIPMTIIIICLVFLISMLIRHEVPKKLCIILYKICKKNDNIKENKSKNISIKKIASKEVCEIKKDMKLCKNVLSGKRENSNSASDNEKTETEATKEEIKDNILVNNENKDKTINEQNDKFEYICNDVFVDTEDEIV